jgi:c-di-GMP-binding flagellar brake protein YcgR
MMKRRKFPRVDQSWRLKYRALDKQVDRESPLSSLAVNVSSGGICFTTAEAVPINSMLAIEVESPELRMPIIAMARTVWCRRRLGDGMYDLGCEFYWVGWKEDSAQKALADYLKSQTADPD